MLDIPSLTNALDLQTLVFFAVIFLVAGSIKGFLGIGLPASAMGFLTLYLPPAEAIPLLWLPILVTNALQFAHAPHKREIAIQYVWFAAAIIVSIFITALFIADYPTALLTVAIGFAMVIFALNSLFGMTLPMGTGNGWQIVMGILAGILGGLSSIWSPVVVMYMVATNVAKEKFIGAIGFIFLMGAIALGAGQIVAGLITLNVLVQSSIALIVVLIGFRIGEALRSRITDTHFRTIVLVAFLIMGIRLIIVGLF